MLGGMLPVRARVHEADGRLGQRARPHVIDPIDIAHKLRRAHLLAEFRAADLERDHVEGALPI